MSQVPVAALAADLCANHSIARVLNVADMVRVEGFKKAWPTSAGFEFSAGTKQRQAAQPAAVNAVLLVVEKAAAKGRLGSVVQQNPAFFGAKPLSENIPLRVA